MTAALFFSRVRLRNDAPIAALAPILLPPDTITDSRQYTDSCGLCSPMALTDVAISCGVRSDQANRFVRVFSIYSRYALPKIHTDCSISKRSRSSPHSPRAIGSVLCCVLMRS
jgi:hypothetical protein